MTPTPTLIPLHVKILIGLAFGTVSGMIASAIFPDATALAWIVDNIAEPVGQVFLRFLLMVVVPLVFTTLVLGIAGIGNMRRLGRLGLRTLSLFIATTLFAASLGLLAVNAIRPGDAISPNLRSTLMATFAPQAADVVEASTQEIGVSTFVNIVPRNPLEAAASGDLIAFIFFTLVFGIAVTQVPEQGRKKLLDVFEAIAGAITVMIGFAMWLAPVGVAGLAFAVTARLGLSVLAPLGLYFGVVMVGLALYQFGILAVLVRFVARYSPLEFYRKSRLPLVTAFSTASSSATLPTTMQTAEEELKVPREVSGFVLPLGATLHMNGTAFFATITVIFLAQVFGVDLSLGTQLMVTVLTALIAISAAGIPSGSIPLLVVMLESVGVPGESIALIFGVEPILGMARTSTNVTGDLFAALVMKRSV